MVKSGLELYWSTHVSHSSCGPRCRLWSHLIYTFSKFTKMVDQSGWGWSGRTEVCRLPFANKFLLAYLIAVKFSLYHLVQTFENEDMKCSLQLRLWALWRCWCSLEVLSFQNSLEYRKGYYRSIHDMSREVINVRWWWNQAVKDVVVDRGGGCAIFIS